MAKTMAEVLARALYVAAHWQDTITEHDSDRKPQAEYERRAGDKWDAGNAGWSNYQRYPRYAEAGAAALSAAGYGLVADAKREALDLQQVADVIMTRVVYAGNEGWTLTAEDRDDHEYAHCLDAAQEIIDGRPQQ